MSSWCPINRHTSLTTSWSSLSMKRDRRKGRLPSTPVRWVSLWAPDIRDSSWVVELIATSSVSRLVRGGDAPAGADQLCLFSARLPDHDSLHLGWSSAETNIGRIGVCGLWRYAGERLDESWFNLSFWYLLGKTGGIHDSALGCARGREFDAGNWFSLRQYVGDYLSLETILRHRLANKGQKYALQISRL